MSMTILVIGATGKQGGHVARLLLRKSHHVRALTRWPAAPAAQALRDLGADIVVGDMTDQVVLEGAANAVDAIFAITTPYEAGVTVEIKQGIALADAVKATEKYLVYSSVASANKCTGIPHFDSKWLIEQHLAEIGADAAVIAPVYFMENLFMQKQRLREGIYPMSLPPDRMLQQIALDDIAAFAVLALENSVRFTGKRINLASDELTSLQEADILSRILGTPIQYARLPIETIREMSEDLAKMYEWFTWVGYDVDIPALHRAYPEINWHTFVSLGGREDWDQF